MDARCELYLTAKKVKPGCVLKTENPEATFKKLLPDMPMIYYAIGKGIAFYSADKRRLEMLDFYPARNIHELVGWFCGYPECCVKEFLKFNALIPALNSYKRKCKGRDPYNLSIDLESVISPLHINWIPCSPECKATRRLVEIYEAMCRW